MNTQLLLQQVSREPYHGWGHLVGGIGCAALATGSVIALGFIGEVIALVSGALPLAFTIIPFVSVPLWTVLPVILGIGALTLLILAIIKIPSKRYQEIRDIKTAAQICELLKTSPQLMTEEIAKRIPEKFWEQFAEETDANIQKYRKMFCFQQMRPLLAEHIHYIPIFLEIKLSNDLELVKLLCHIRPEFAKKVASSSEVLKEWGCGDLTQFIFEQPEVYAFFPFTDQELADVFSEDIDRFNDLVETYPDLLEQRPGVITSLAERGAIDLESFASRCVFSLPQDLKKDLNVLANFVRLNRAFFSQVEQKYQTQVLEYLDAKEILEIAFREHGIMVLPGKMFESESFASLVSLCQEKEQYIVQLKSQVEVWSAHKLIYLFSACGEALKFLGREIVFKLSQNYSFEDLATLVDLSLSPFPLSSEICSGEYLGWFLEDEKRCSSFLASVNQMNENKADLISEILGYYPILFYELALKTQCELYQKIEAEKFAIYAMQSPEKIILAIEIPLEVYFYIIESGISKSALSDEFVRDLFYLISDDEFFDLIERDAEFISVFINCIDKNEHLFAYSKRIEELYRVGGEKERLKLISSKGPELNLSDDVLKKPISMQRIISRDQRYLDQLLQSGIIERFWTTPDILDVIIILDGVIFFNGTHWIGCNSRLDMFLAKEIPTVKGESQIVQMKVLREDLRLMVQVIRKNFKYFDEMGGGLHHHPELIAWLYRIYPEHRDKILNAYGRVDLDYERFLFGQHPPNLLTFSNKLTELIYQNPEKALLKVMRRLGDGTPIPLRNGETIYRYLLPSFNIGRGIDAGGPTRDACCAILNALFDSEREGDEPRISFTKANGLILPSVKNEWDANLYKALGGFLYAIRMNQYKPIIGKIFHSLVFDTLQSIKLSYLEEIIDCEFFEELSLKAAFSILVPLMKLSKRSDAKTLERYLNNHSWVWDQDSENLDAANIGYYLEELDMHEMVGLCFNKKRTEEEDKLLEEYIEEHEEIIFEGALEVIGLGDDARGMFCLIQGFVKDRYIAEVVSSGLLNLEIDLQGELDVEHFFDHCIIWEVRDRKTIEVALRFWVNEPLNDPDLNEQERKTAQNLRLKKLIYYVTGNRSMPLNPSDKDKLKIGVVNVCDGPFNVHTCFKKVDINSRITRGEIINALDNTLTNATFEEIGSYTTG